MEKKRIRIEPAYVLHAHPYRESSLLIDIFSQHHGKVRLVARGVRQKNTKKSFLFQPFLKGYFSWAGRGPLYPLLSAEDHPDGLYLFAPDQLGSGLYANELLLKLLAYEDPCPMLYDAYCTFLACLSALPTKTPEDRRFFLEITLRCFEKKLVDQLGYGIDFESIKKQNYYLFNKDKGLMTVVSPTADTIPGESLMAFKNEDWQPHHLPAIKKLMRGILADLLDGKALKTRELFL